MPVMMFKFYEMDPRFQRRHLIMVVIILKVEQKIGSVDVRPGEVTSILGR